MLGIVGLINRISFWGIFLGLVLWVVAHRAFWLQYHRTYPDRRGLDRVRLWFFRYLPRMHETRIVWTPQQDPKLERRRRFFVAIWYGGALCGTVYWTTLFMLGVAPGS